MRYCEAKRELTEWTHRIADFNSPDCGYGPHSDLEDQRFLECLLEEEAENSTRAQAIKREADLLNRLIDLEPKDEAYELLASQFSANMDWVMFLEAAQKSKKTIREFDEFTRRQRRSDQK